MFARNVATLTIAKVGFRILADVPGASMTKAQPQAPEDHRDGSFDQLSYNSVLYCAS